MHREFEGIFQALYLTSKGGTDGQEINASEFSDQEATFIKSAKDIEFAKKWGKSKLIFQGDASAENYQERATLFMMFQRSLQPEDLSSLTDFMNMTAALKPGYRFLFKY